MSLGCSVSGVAEVLGLLVTGFLNHGVVESLEDGAADVPIHRFALLQSRRVTPLQGVVIQKF